MKTLNEAAFETAEEFRATVAQILVKRVYSKIREEMGVGA